MVFGHLVEFLSTSPLRGTTLVQMVSVRPARCISIHVPLAGDDLLQARLQCRARRISIHVPLAGDDCMPFEVLYACPISIHVPLAGDD